MPGRAWRATLWPSNLHVPQNSSLHPSLLWHGAPGVRQIPSSVTQSLSGRPWCLLQSLKRTRRRERKVRGRADDDLSPITKDCNDCDNQTIYSREQPMVPFELTTAATCLPTSSSLSAAHDHPCRLTGPQHPPMPKTEMSTPSLIEVPSLFLFEQQDSKNHLFGNEGRF